MVKARFLKSMAIAGLIASASFGASASAQDAQAERADRIGYLAYAGGVVLVAVIIAGVVLVDTEDSVSP